MFRSALVAILFLCLSGCGLKGPLYLPDEPATETKILSQEPENDEVEEEET